MNWLDFKTKRGPSTLPQLNIYIWACRGELVCVCGVLLLLTPNQRQTCVASRCKSSFTWNISVRGHRVTTAPFSHAELTLPPPQPPCLSFHHSPSCLLIWSSVLVLLGRGEHPFVEGMDPFPQNLIKGEFKMAATELRSCQIKWANPLLVLLGDICFILVSKISCLSWRRRQFPHERPDSHRTPSVITRCEWWSPYAQS